MCLRKAPGTIRSAPVLYVGPNHRPKCESQSLGDTQAMEKMAGADLTDFTWSPQPQAARIVERALDGIVAHSPELAQLGARMLQETGTRLIDWIDHLMISEVDASAAELSDAGFGQGEFGGHPAWQHPGGLFPPLVIGYRSGAAIKVNSIADFLLAQRLQRRDIEGYPGSQLRRARLSAAGGVEVWAVERHGCLAWQPQAISAEKLQTAVAHHEAFRLRKRDFESDAEGFENLLSLVRDAKTDLGTDWACDLFFEAERAYWQSRNRAGQLQKMRQDALGLGWANHDHHTYRSSREHFARLIRILEELGMVCRERFYAGSQAGWGAQVLEQPVSRVVVFADVDLSPDEVAGDFAHDELPPRDRLGTVGLWCKLHGEAVLQAGMHHLECQFDFSAAREQLANYGAESMKPFTDFAFLRQAFTEGDMWPVEPARIERALAEGYITADQAAQFRTQGALGSHLEILERNDGYKGFNQTGISEIIEATDPRRHV